MLQAPAQHLVVVVEILALAGRAGAAVGNIHRHRLRQRAGRDAIAGVARARHHGRDGSGVDADHVAVAGAGIAAHPVLDHEIHAAPRLEEGHGLVVRLDDAGEAAQLRDHVGQRGALVDRQAAHGAAGVLEHHANGPAGADRIHLQQVEHDVLGGHARGQCALHLHAQGLRHLAAHVARHPAIGKIGGAGAERQATERTRMGRVRIGAHHHLARQRVLLGHQRMADAFRARHVAGQRVVRAHRVVVREAAMALHQVGHARQQAVAHMREALRRQHQVILEGDDVVGLVQRGRLAEGAVHQVRAHAGEVVVREAPVGRHEHALAALGGWRARQQMAGDDLLHQRARRGAGGFPGAPCAPRRRPARRAAIGQQSAGADHLLGQRVAPAQEGLDGNRLARQHAVQHREIRGGQDADVVAVLLVDALEALRHDQADAGGQLRQRAGLARGSLAVALARHRDGKAAVADGIAADRQLGARLEPHIRELPQPLIVGQHDRHRRDLVGGDVVAQRAGLGQGHGLAVELGAHAGGILRQVQHAAVEADGGFHGGVLVLMIPLYGLAPPGQSAESAWQASRFATAGR